jgi:hypothetical protein
VDDEKIRRFREISGHSLCALWIRPSFVIKAVREEMAENLTWNAV